MIVVSVMYPPYTQFLLRCLLIARHDKNATLFLDSKSRVSGRPQQNAVVEKPVVHVARAPLLHNVV